MRNNVSDMVLAEFISMLHTVSVYSEGCAGMTFKITLFHDYFRDYFSYSTNGLMNFSYELQEGKIGDRR